MANEFLGRGWTFPVVLKKDRNSISMSEYEEDIKEAIRIILSTSKGERVMRPDFGCDINNLAFSVINTQNLTIIQDNVREAIVKWEPRVDILNIIAQPEDVESGKLNINIDYKVRRTNSRYNMVYPFYLKE